MSAHHAGMNSRRWALLRMRIFQRDGWRCTNCGRAGRLECDHVLPLDRGGDMWSPDNLQSLCVDCHLDKSRRERGGPEIYGRDEWQAFVQDFPD